jgi:hypothetical protein
MSERAEKIVEVMINTLEGYSGFGDWWDHLHAEKEYEIVTELEAAVERELD